LTSETSYSVAAQGALVPVTTRYEYNSDGQPTKTIYPDSSSSSKSYNDRGLVASATDRAGATVTYSYDPAGRMSRTNYPDGSFEEMAYDAVGRMISERNTRGQIATSTFDDADRVIAETTPDLGTRVRTFDKVGRIVSETDEGGRTSTTAYDPVGNVTKLSYPDGTSTNLTYDEVNNLQNASARVFFEPSSVGFGYNPVPAGTDLSVPGAFTPTFVAGNLRSAVAPAGAAKNIPGYKVSPAGFVQGPFSGQHYGMGKTVRRIAQANSASSSLPPARDYLYVYDANGRVTSITNPDLSRSSIEYDALGRPTKTVNEEGQTWTYIYDPSSNNPAYRTSVTGPAGYEERYFYDPIGNLGGTIDALGNITEWVYNTANQLTSTKYSNSTGALSSIESYDDFDAQGRARRFRDREGFETTIDDRRSPNSRAGIRTLSRKVGTEDYQTIETYDSAGNLTQIEDPRHALTLHAYDFLNRRILTTLPDGRKIQTVYGPGNRIDKIHEISSDGTDIRTTEYQYDRNNQVTRSLHSHREPADTIAVDSEYAADGRPTSVSTPYLPGEAIHKSVIGYDDLNHVTTITDPMGRVTYRKSDRLGRLTEETDTAGTLTRHTYDELNRLTSVTVVGQPDAETHDVITRTTELTYDKQGNLLTRTEAAGTPDARTTTFAYDYLGNGTLATTTLADGSSTKSFQDTRGLVTAVTSARGNTTTTAFDALGCPTRPDLDLRLSQPRREPGHHGRGGSHQHSRVRWEPTAHRGKIARCVRATTLWV